MAVPKYNEFFPTFLDCLADGKNHTLKEIRTYCAEAFHLSDADRQMTLTSGQNTLYNRVSWAGSYLKKAGLIESPHRATFRITEEGKKVVKKGTSCVTLQYLQENDCFSNSYRESKSYTTQDVFNQQVQNENSPLEDIENACNKINDSLASDLLDEILKMQPFEFENLVVKLLIKMGYGSRSNSIVTKKPVTRV